MSPILVRPVREQLEHDRIIRLLQAKYKRKFEVAINPGNVQAAPVGTPPDQWYPDLVLHSQERGRKLLGVVEVETAESVNNLEAMSQWGALSRIRAEFHLYVPSGSIDTARRLCSDLQIDVAEIWAYSSIGDQLRFTLVQRSPHASEARARTAPAASASNARARTVATRRTTPATRRAAPKTAGARRKTAAKPRVAARKAAVPRGRAAAKSAASRAQKKRK